MVSGSVRVGAELALFERITPHLPPPEGGNGLYRTRAVRVACLDRAQLRQPADIMQAIPPPQRDYFQMVQLHSDGAGRIWAVNRMLDRYRKRLQNNWGTAGWWEVVLTALEGDRWLPAVKLASTAGRNDVRVAVPTAASDDLWLAWSRDGRSFRRVIPQQAQTWRTLLDNHVKQLVSIGFFTVPTIRFQIL